MKNRQTSGTPEGGQFKASRAGMLAPTSLPKRVQPVERVEHPSKTVPQTVSPNVSNSGGMLTTWASKSVEIDSNVSREWPQANEVSKVVASTVAVREGANTATTIAQTLGVVERQGSYYAVAAESLGLLDKIPGTSPAAWEVSAFGETVAGLDGDPVEQAAVVAETVNAHPSVRAYNVLGDDALRERAEADGLSPETAERRAATAKAWSQWAANVDHTVLTTEMASAARLAPAAAERARQDAATRQARIVVQPTAKICSECFTEKSLTGFCGNGCDD